MLLFFLHQNTILTILIFSEFIWVVLYVYATYCANLIDELTLLSSTLFLLTIAGLEFSTGLLLAILIKNFKNFFTLNKKSNFTNTVNFF